MNGYIANPTKLQLEDNIVTSDEHVFVYTSSKVLVINPNIDIDEIIVFPSALITKNDNYVISKADICRIKIKESYYYVDAYQFIRSFKLQYLNLSYPIPVND